MRYLLLVLFSAVSLHLLSQQKIGAKITYEVILTPRQLPLLTEGVLYIDGNRSLFVSNVGAYPGQIVNDENGVSDMLSLDPQGNQVEKDFSNGLLNLREIVMSDLFVSTEKMPKFNWDLKNESKQIGPYHCSKAIATFRGRDYVAWYAVEVPISEGPWKFYGLPGLIISVEDTGGLYKFNCVKVEIPYRPQKSEKFQFSSDGKVVSIDEFRRAYYTVFEQWANLSRAESEGAENFEIKMNDYHPIELQFADEN